MLDAVTSCPRIENLRYTCKASIVKVAGGISLCISGNSKRNEESLAYSSCCVLESKQILAKKRFLAQFTLGCRSNVNEYITRVSCS